MAIREGRPMLPMAVLVLGLVVPMEAMTVVDMISNREIFLGIFSNVCPLLGDFGPEGIDVVTKVGLHKD